MSSVSFSHCLNDSRILKRNEEGNVRKRKVGHQKGRQFFFFLWLEELEGSSGKEGS